MEPGSTGVVRSSLFRLLIWLSKSARPELSDVNLAGLNRGVFVKSDPCRHVPTGLWRLLVSVAPVPGTAFQMGPLVY